MLDEQGARCKSTTQSPLAPPPPPLSSPSSLFPGHRLPRLLFLLKFSLFVCFICLLLVIPSSSVTTFFLFCVLATFFFLPTSHSSSISPSLSSFSSNCFLCCGSAPPSVAPSSFSLVFILISIFFPSLTSPPYSSPFFTV